MTISFVQCFIQSVLVHPGRLFLASRGIIFAHSFAFTLISSSFAFNTVAYTIRLPHNPVTRKPDNLPHKYHSSHIPCILNICPPLVEKQANKRTQVHFKICVWLKIIIPLNGTHRSLKFNFQMFS